MQAGLARGVAAPRRLALAALALGVAGLHLWLLRPFEPAPAAPGAVAAAASTVIWQVVGPVAPPAAATPAATAPIPARRATPAARSGAPAVPAPPTSPRATAIVATTGAPTVAPAAPPGPAARRSAGAPAERPVPAADDRGRAADGAAGTPGDSPPLPATEPVPVYATQLPPPARLHYRLQRDGAPGAARLEWQPDGAQYLLRLQGEVDGRPLGGAASRGAIDADGLAPVRLADLKRGREVRAANFRRDERRITFSGPAVEQPLPPGTQDRLSWMIQLPAVVEANPGLRHAGARVTLLVVGTRGDAEAWHFDAQGAEPVELPGSVVPAALRFVRAAARPYDLQVEVWLDPARGHLPVRARLATRPETRTTEWELAAVETP